MKNQSLSVIVTVTTLLIGLVGLPSSVQGSDTILSKPGHTILFELEYDLQLRNCDITSPDIPCSLPPGAPLYLPDYFDITKAAITQIGREMVDLSIDLAEPIPAAPPYPFVAYYWQFEGGCLVPAPGNKSAITVIWQDYGAGWEWRAHWIEITNCGPPRIITVGDQVPFVFTDTGLRVRVAVDDLLTATDPPESLKWHVGVRVLSFINPTFTRTVAVDSAPDVIEFNPAPPPYIINPEEPAEWGPR